MALLRAAKANDKKAKPLYDAFMPLATLRYGISLIRVLHDAVMVSKIADMGPIMPLLSSTPVEHHAKIEVATQALLEFERGLAQTSARS